MTSGRVLLPSTCPGEGSCAGLLFAPWDLQGLWLTDNFSSFQNKNSGEPEAKQFKGDEEEETVRHR